MKNDTPTIEWLEGYYTPAWVKTCLEKGITPADVEWSVRNNIPIQMAPSTYRRLIQHWGITAKNCNEIPMPLTEILARKRIKGVS